MTDLPIGVGREFVVAEKAAVRAGAAVLQFTKAAASRYFCP